MANYKFVVRNLKATTPQTIYITARFGRNDKLMYATSLKIEPLFWDSVRQRAKSSMYCVNADNINAALGSLASFLNEFSTKSVQEGRPINKGNTIRALDEYLGKVNHTSTFHQFFEEYIQELETKMNGRRGGQLVTYKTKREYVRTLSYIKDFEKRKRIYLDFQDFDKPLLQSFVGYLQSLNLATNTIAHKIISLKALLREAVERELTDNTKWQSFKHVTEETDAVALNEEELEKIRIHDFSEDTHLEKIRDLFLIECWTGLRYSDVIRLRQEHIHGNLIVIQQQKTNNNVTIPIHPVFREVWNKYGGLPIIISNQKYNKHIKEVCKQAGIKESVMMSITKGGKKITTKYKKWELVSSHTARRSFATNLYRSGFPSISIMQITGHKTETAFLKYIKVTPMEHAQLLAKHWEMAAKNE